MKTIFLLLLTSLFIWANESFYDIYAKNRSEKKPNFITADFIVSAYATYKIKREQNFENKILIPRVLNFVNYLYKGVIEYNIPNKEQALAYASVVALLSNDKNNITIPDGYEHLKSNIIKEAKLVIDANCTAQSPIMKTKIDYTQFKIPTKYTNNAPYFRVLKYLQILPVPKEINNTILASERLSNLKNSIEKNLKELTGLEQKAKGLFPLYVGLDNNLFKKDGIKTLDDIANLIKNDKTIKEHILNLNSSYDYDFKIMQNLIKNNHINAFKGYLIQSLYRTQIYKKAIMQKSAKDNRKYADIEDNLEELLSIMIEGTFTFSNCIINKKIDKNMVNILKKLRKISQKKSLKIALNEKDIKFLNNLDTTFLNIINAKNKPIKVKIDKKLSLQLIGAKISKSKNNTIGGRYLIEEVKE